MKKQLVATRAGFSLVEVVIALGLVSVGVLSVVGLLGTTMAMSRQSQDDVVLVSMSTQVLASLRAGAFESLSAGELQDDGEAEGGAQNGLVFYFNLNGDQVQGSSGELEGDPFWECRVKATPDETLQGVGGGEHNLVQIELFFSWPIVSHSVPEQRQGQCKIYSSVARYE